MANQPRTKNKPPKPPRPELEPISYEEIMGNAGMSGFVSFLDGAFPGQGTETAQVDTVQEPDTVQGSAAVPQSKPDPDTVQASDTVQGSYTVQEPYTVQEVDTVQQSKPAEPYTVQGRRQGRRARFTRAASTEDGHSLAEEQLYRLLWDSGEPEAAGETRTVRIGYDRLAARARMSWLTVKNNLRSLERKLALEVAAAEDSTIRAGKQYRVFSPAAIFARRESAGLVWVHRTRGVELLSQLPPAPLPNSSKPQWGQPFRAAAALPRGVPPPESAPPMCIPCARHKAYTMHRY
jgi:hypothetical protein